MRLQITIVSDDAHDVERMNDLLTDSTKHKLDGSGLSDHIVHISERATITVRESVQRPRQDVGPVISKPPGAIDITAGSWECSRCKHVNPNDTIHCFYCGRQSDVVEGA